MAPGKFCRLKVERLASLLMPWGLCILHIHCLRPDEAPVNQICSFAQQVFRPLYYWVEGCKGCRERMAEKPQNYLKPNRLVANAFMLHPYKTEWQGLTQGKIKALTTSNRCDETVWFTAVFYRCMQHFGSGGAALPALGRPPWTAHGMAQLQLAYVGHRPTSTRQMDSKSATYFLMNTSI